MTATVLHAKPRPVERVYLTRPAAVREALGPGAVREVTARLSPEAKGRAERRLHARLTDAAYEVAVTSVGYALVVEETGQEKPITFLVATDRNLRVTRLLLMIYREAFGEQVGEPRFTRQFLGKAPTDRLEIHRDIDAVSGATFSSAGMTRGVKRALVVLDELRREGALR